MKMEKLTNSPATRFLILAVVILALATFFFGNQTPFVSSEVAFTDTSPQGGKVVPASCPSNTHFPGECSYSEAAYYSEGGYYSEGSYAPSNPAFSCEPQQINQGQPVTLSWQCSDSTGSAGVNFSTGGAVSGEVTINPSVDTTYSIQCSNGGTATCSVDVLDPSISIDADPERVRSGETALITWSGVNVNTCVVRGPNDFYAESTAGSQESEEITEQSTFTLVCENDAGVLTDSVIVRLIPGFEEF